MNKHVLLIDGNSVGHYANGCKPLVIGSMKVHAIFHFLREMRGFLSTFAGAEPIILWDGLSWRKTVYAEYKANREANNTPSAMKKLEENVSYHKQKPYIQKAMSFLGVKQAVASNMEADDLAAILTNAYLSKGYRVTLISEDADWIQLVRPGVNCERLRSARVTVKNFTEATGCVDAKQFIQKKALMGDSGDNIKGVGGLGEKYATEFLATYGSFDAFLEGVMLKNIDYDALPKRYRDLVDNEEKAIKFSNNLRLVDLNTSKRPKVEGFAVNHGEPSVENFTAFCETLMFKTMTNDIDLWVSVFPVAQKGAIAA